jgi:hypothetical protein
MMRLGHNVPEVYYGLGKSRGIIVASVSLGEKACLSTVCVQLIDPTIRLGRIKALEMAHNLALKPLFAL